MGWCLFLYTVADKQACTRTCLHPQTWFLLFLFMMAVIWVWDPTKCGPGKVTTQLKLQLSTAMCLLWRMNKPYDETCFTTCTFKVLNKSDNETKQNCLSSIKFHRKKSSHMWYLLIIKTQRINITLTQVHAHTKILHNQHLAAYVKMKSKLYTNYSPNPVHYCCASQTTTIFYWDIERVSS